MKLYKNIFYMLAYAFTSLKFDEMQDLAEEEFDNIEDMLSNILTMYLLPSLKKGMYKEYIDKTEDLFAVKGKILINESISSNVRLKNKLVCNFDEFSENTLINQIIKTSLYQLINGKTSDKNKIKLKQFLFFFKNVNLINVKDIKWKHLYNKSNLHYKNVIFICELILLGFIQTEGNKTQGHKFIDETKMSALYEHFIFNYYVKEHSDKVKVIHPAIRWNLDESYDNNSYLLPNMQTDIVLKSKSTNKILVIDAKYYTNNLQERHEKQTVMSSHLYQVFAYITNYASAENVHTISGLLLYAKTDKNIQPELDVKINGLRLGATTLNLLEDFSVIREKFEHIINQYLI